MHAETPQQSKCGALDELVIAAAPVRDLGPGMRRTVEQVEAHGVADAPVVEGLAPAVHLCGRELCGISNERGHHARLVHTRVPESGGEFMVSSEALAQYFYVSVGNTECIVRGKGIAGHAVEGGLSAVALQPFERRLNFILEQCLCFGWLGCVV